MRKIKLFIAALMLSVSSLLGLNIGKVFAATCTWTGASNDNFNTAANWSNCGGGVPQNGDNITFDSASLSSTKTLTNDITGLSVGTITFTGTNSSGYTYKLTGNTLTITGGIVANAGAVLDLSVTIGTSQTWSGSSYIYIGEFGGTSRTLAVGSNTLTISPSASLYLYGALTGSGTISNSGTLELNKASSSWSGAINATATGTTRAFVDGALGSGAVTVASGGALIFCGVNGATFSNAITLGGASALGAFVACGMGGGSDTSPANVTLSGNIALTANTTVNTAGVTTITGPLSGDYTIGVASGATGSLVINSSNNTSKTPNGTVGASAETVTIEAGDDQPNTAVTVGGNQTYIINGTRGATTIQQGGTLKGTGVVGDLLISGTVAPGQSPGCLTAGSLQFEAGSVYEFEAAGATACSQYDQLKTGGTVAINGGTVQLTLLDGFKPKQGQVFTIIDNTGAGAVSGAFTNLPEGATFAANGYVYKISYTGGTGNDVTLTVMTVPASPDTGFAMVKNNPLMTMLAMVVIGGTLLMVSRRTKLAGMARKR